MKRTEKFWDRIAKQWDAGGNKLDEDSTNLIGKTRKHLKPSDIVLDYGCGTGTIANEIAAYVREIYGSDISPGMIEVAKRTAGERKIENIHYAQSTIYDEMYKNESFDVITAFNILHLVEETPKVIQRINELLKPGGVFISTTPCLGEKRSFLGFILSLLSKTRLVPKISMLTTSVLEDLVISGNFQIIEAETQEQSLFITAKKK
jgi:2-polyprenyl-3-methyl-5-hydroxy-6-metoxy-1,4-benzoquinol methylase